MSYYHYRLFIGIEMYRMVGDRRQGEFKEGKPNGKMTWYRPDGKVYNYIYEDGLSKNRQEVTDPRDAWFGDGVPVLIEK